MIYAIGSLIGIGLVLFILSFFMHDRFKELDELIESVSLSSIQNFYKINKKLNVLEEELLVDKLDGIDPSSKDPNVDIQIPTIEKIKDLHNEGKTSFEIARKTNLDEEDIKAIIRNIH